MLIKNNILFLRKCLCENLYMYYLLFYCIFILNFGFLLFSGTIIYNLYPRAPKKAGTCSTHKGFAFSKFSGDLF